MFQKTVFQKAVFQKAVFQTRSDTDKNNSLTEKYHYISKQLGRTTESSNEEEEMNKSLGVFKKSEEKQKKL